MLLSQGFFLQERYRIEMLLGRGGMGAVYKATDTRLGHAVAIKQNLFEAAEGTAPISHHTRPDDTEARRTQFEREARLLASLKHTGLAKVTDYFFIPGEGQYLVMDFIDGQDFGAVVHQLGALREEHAAGFIIEIAQVLEYLHAQAPPIIHRDIKPANIRVTPQGQVFLVDFGVAKVGTGEKTMFGAQAVTPGFSPLEQFGGDKPTDQRADVYSLAATLYTLTLGRQPPSAIDVLRGRALFDPAGNGLRPALIDVINRGMALEPEDRYASMTQFREALQVVFPARSRQAQSLDTVNLVTQIYTQPLQSPGSEMGVIGPTGRPATGHPGQTAPPTMGNPTTGSRGAMTAPPGTTPPSATYGPAATAPAVTGVPPAYAPPPVYATPPSGPPPYTPPPSGPTPYADRYVPPPTGPSTGPPPAAPREKRNSPVLMSLIWAGVVIVALVLGRDIITRLIDGSKKPSGGTTDQATNTPQPAADRPDGSSGAASGSASSPPATPAPARVDPPGTATPGAGSESPASGNGSDATGSGAGSAANDRTDRAINPPVVPPPAASNTGTTTPPRDNPRDNPRDDRSTTPPGTSVAPPPTPSRPDLTTPAKPTTPPPAPGAALGTQLLVSGAGDGQYRTLEEALQAHYDSGAKVSRTITLRAGTYRLPPDLVLHTPIEITGQGNVVLQGTGSTAAIRVRQPGIVLHDLTITSSGQYGLLVVGAGAVDLRNCNISNNREAALALTETGRATGLNVTLSGANFGLISDGTSQATMTGATITGNGIGVQARAGSTIRLNGGKVVRSRQSGLLVATGGTISATGTTLADNGGNGATARAGRLTLNGVTISNNTQFGLLCESPAGVIDKIGVTFVGNKMGETQGCP